MKTLSYFFFNCYICLVILAGFWEAFLFCADFDQQLLFNLDNQTLLQTLYESIYLVNIVS